MAASSCVGLITLDVFAQQIPEGIHHYELLVLTNPAQENSPENAAFEVTDCGLVAGRHTEGGVTKGFVWLSRDLYGHPSHTMLNLSYPGFPGCEAYDLSDDGFVVGILGNSTSLLGGPMTRGAVWNLSAGLQPTAVPPPPGWPSSGSSFLQAISTNPPHSVVGWAQSPSLCFGGTPRKIAMQFWPATNTYVAAEPAMAPTTAFGVSESSTLVVGNQTQCNGTGSTCTSESLSLLWRAEGTALVSSDRSPPPSAQYSLETSELRAVVDDGVGAGFMFDVFNIMLGCEQRAVAWRNLATTTDAVVLPPTFGASSSLLADDLEKSWDGLGHFGVGIIADETSSTHGVLWHHATTAEWNSLSWTWLDINAAISPLHGAEVLRLRGVNRYGDCVGTALIGTQHGPVFLRAVRCVGDLDHSGVVGAEDLAILLNSWECGLPCEASADLNIDGAINALDLSTLLNQWGGCLHQRPACANVAVDVPEQYRIEAREKLDFSLQYVGLSDLLTYRTWTETVPAPLREIVDQAIWRILKDE